MENGYNIIPVNPVLENWEGKKVYSDVKSIEGNIDVVDIFRRPEFIEDNSWWKTGILYVTSSLEMFFISGMALLSFSAFTDGSNNFPRIYSGINSIMILQPLNLYSILILLTRIVERQ